MIKSLQMSPVTGINKYVYPYLWGRAIAIVYSKISKRLVKTKNNYFNYLRSIYLWHIDRSTDTKLTDIWVIIIFMPVRI